MSTRSIKEYAILAIKGMAMGAADIVPGVSGGTVALITGIYQELLDSLQSLTPLALKTLWQQGWAAFWKEINGGFLLALFIGIALSLKTLAALVSWCLDHQPLLIWSAFSGLIVASLLLLLRHQRWSIAAVLLFFVGAAIVVFIATARPTQLPDAPWVLFAGGFVAICAMILPGISGSFILLLVGLYPVFLRAIETLDIVALASFGLGCVCGLMAFSRFLSWLLARWYAQTMALMLGFLLGSLYVTWPWKRVVETTVDRHGELVPLLQVNVSPFQFEQFSGQASQLGLCVLVFAVALASIVLLEFWAGRRGGAEGSDRELAQ